MNKKRLAAIVAIIGLTAAIVTTLPLAQVQAMSGHPQAASASTMDMKSHIKKKPLTLEQVHDHNLPMASKSVDKAIKALQAGDDKTALTELLKAQKMLAVIHEAIGKHVPPKFANVRCPIMNSPIVPGKVTKKLIREYKGQKIAFCCAGCPSAWDKLTDAKKDAKLAGMKPKPTDPHAGHKH